MLMVRKLGLLLLMLRMGRLIRLQTRRQRRSDTHATDTTTSAAAAACSSSSSSAAAAAAAANPSIVVPRAAKPKLNLDAGRRVRG